VATNSAVNRGSRIRNQVALAILDTSIPSVRFLPIKPLAAAAIPAISAFGADNPMKGDDAVRDDTHSRRQKVPPGRFPFPLRQPARSVSLENVGKLGRQPGKAAQAHSLLQVLEFLSLFVYELY
jgi:hypothetical protein